MAVEDYLIDHSGLDWPVLLAGWAPLLPPSMTVWLMNRFGDLFLVFDDGSVHHFDIGRGTIERIAADREEFIALFDDGDNANQWLMMPLVDRAVACGLTLKPGECYGYKLSPVLGGAYTVENAMVLPISEHFAFHSDLHEQIRDLPDGASVELKVIPGSE